jgi:hypothetical protein
MEKIMAEIRENFGYGGSVGTDHLGHRVTGKNPFEKQEEQGKPGQIITVSTPYSGQKPLSEQFFRELGMKRPKEMEAVWKDLSPKSGQTKVVMATGDHVVSARSASGALTGFTVFLDKEKKTVTLPIGAVMKVVSYSDRQLLEASLPKFMEKYKHGFIDTARYSLKIESERAEEAIRDDEESWLTQDQREVLRSLAV